MATYVIVGNSAGAIGAVEAIRQVDKAGSIVLLSEEEYPVYSRPMISEYLAGEANLDQMLYRPREFYARNHVEALLGRRAVALDLTEKSVRLEDGSTIGFEIRTVGANPDAARYAGMRPRMLVILTMTVGGLLAGLAGAIEILGVQGYLPAAYATTVGFDAITVALLGRSNPIAILFAGLLLGALRAGAPLMQIKAQVPVQMIDILQGIILFFLAADVIVRHIFRLRATAGGGVTGAQTISRTYGGRTTP